jgi:hypothetical protein
MEPRLMKERKMKKLFVAAAASALMLSLPAFGISTAALAQSDTGEAASGGVAGGDSAGSAGSARGGNGPSETGEAASGGKAGGDAPDSPNADAPGQLKEDGMSAKEFAPGQLKHD